MATTTVVNTLPTPLIIDEAGHVLAAHTRGPVDPDEPRVQTALAAKQFFEVATVSPPTPQPPAPTPDVALEATPNPGVQK